MFFEINDNIVFHEQEKKLIQMTHMFILIMRKDNKIIDINLNEFL